MLMVLAFILLVAWLLGIVGTYTVGAIKRRLADRFPMRLGADGGGPT